MYVLVSNQVVKTYPYSFEQLKKDNPQTSYPKNPSVAALESYGMFAVVATNKPEVDYTKTVTEGTPVRQRVRNTDGTFVADNPETPENEAWEWVQVWNVTDATTEEIEQRTEQKADSVRQERNDRLSDSDWTQGKDIPDSVSASWAEYRQALRDVPQQEGFPWEVEYPQKPAFI